MKKESKNKKSFRDLWNIKQLTFQHFNQGTSEEEQEEGTENLLEEVMTKNFCHLARETNIQAPEAQKAPKRRKQRDPHQDVS